jgi:RNA polymerase sigma-70 factor (ECF subfamily)
MSANPVIERPRLAPSEGSPQERTGDLYERYYDRVFGYCLYKLGDRQEAEDATQTTFLWVMRGLAHGIEPRLEANWLFTIAQNACRARIKTRGRKREQETLSDPQILERVAPGRITVQDELLGLEGALRDMPELQRQAIILREWRGFSYKEIAAELDLTDAAVETLIFRARRSLASRLENPNAGSAKRATLAVNLGWLLSGVKSFFAFGGAANLTALAASAAAVAIGLGIQGDTPAGPADQLIPPKAAQPAVVPANDAKPAQGARERAKERRDKKGSRQGSAQRDPSAPVAHAPAETPPTPPVGGVVDTSTGTLTPVTNTVDQALDTADEALGTVDQTLAEVDGVIGQASETLEPVVPQLPPLP